MLSIFLVVLLFIVAYCVYNFVMVPRRLKAHYVNSYKSKGYRVLELPYQPMGAPYFEMLARSEKEKGDTFYNHKHSFHQYDMIISNVLNHVELVLLNEKLIKETMTQDRLTTLHKHHGPYGIFLMIIERGIVVVEDQQWKNRKKVISKVFNYDFIAEQIPSICTLADKVLDQFENKYWNVNPDKKPIGEFQVKLYDLMVKFTSQVVISGFLGMEALSEEVKGQSITELIVRLSDLGTLALKDPLLILFGKKFLNLRLRQKDRDYQDLFKLVNSILKYYIQRMKKDISNPEAKANQFHTVAELLMMERKKSLEANEKLYSNDQDLIDQIKTFLVAGSETTSNFISAMFMYVFEKPEIVSRLRNQINSVIKSDKDFTVDNFKKMPYLDCIINQVSRVFSTAVGLFEKQVVSSTNIGNVQLEKGVCIQSHWVSLMYDPETFKNPHQFRPERWEQQETKKYSQLISMIFSGGPRSCIGKYLALTEIKVMTIKFMQRYETLVEPMAENRQFELLLTYHMKHDKVTIKKKKE